MVALLPVPETAGKLAFDNDAQSEWRAFVRGFVQRHGYQVDALEIGNAPNRPKWSGYTPRSYLTAWKIAIEEARGLNAPIAGPNISDFEPFFNIAYLRSMRRIGPAPDIQTDNLFVERAVQPEAYDPSAMGRLLKNIMRFNLAKKIRVLTDIATRIGIDETYCSYTCWTQARLARWTAEPERKGADYLSRYLLIAAATGRLSRLYWGPLIDFRDGLIDCGCSDYPVVDNVAHYQSVRGDLADFRHQPTFWAFKFFSQLLRDAQCHRAFTTGAGLYCFVLADADQVHHVYFSLDRTIFKLGALYANLDQAEVRDTQGRILDRFNGLVGESPVVITLSEKAALPEDLLRRLAPLGGADVVHGLNKSDQASEFSDVNWHGVVSTASTDSQLTPYSIDSLQPIRALRDKRNKLWTVRSPSHNRDLVIKLNRATGARRLSYLFGKSKALRHWNNATEMLRRGVSTPTPVAFFERHRFRGVRANYYVAEFVDDSFTARDIFAAIKNGDAEYRGIQTQDWLQVLAEFVGFMHRRRIVHRDLSAGNLLIQLHDGEPLVSVIDIGRATIDSNASILLDLQRICYKLDWPNRQAFIKHYKKASPRSSTRFWRLACHAYDFKLDWKRALKRALRGKRKATK